MYFSYTFLQNVLMLCVLAQIAAEDAAIRRISNGRLCAFICCALLFRILCSPKLFFPSLLFSGCLLLLLLPLHKRGLGGGDIKLMAALGFAYPGWNGIYMLLYACCFGIAFQIIQCRKAVKRRKALKERLTDAENRPIPFGACLFGGAMLALFLRSLGRCTA